MTDTAVSGPRPPADRRCVRCGAELSPTDVYCPRCGTDQRSAEPQASEGATAVEGVAAPAAPAAPAVVAPAPPGGVDPGAPSGVDAGAPSGVDPGAPAALVIERSRGAKLRELAVVLLMFGVMVFVVRRSFELGDEPTPIPTAAVTPTAVPTPAAVAGELELVAAPPEITADTSASFAYTWSGTLGGGFECRLDQERFEPCDPSGALLVDLPDGIHTFQVRLVLDEGPTEPVSHSWTVDATVPSLAMTPAGGGFVSAPLVTLEASEPAVVYYTLDGSDPSAESATYRAPIRIEAPSTVRAVAIDEAGNASPVVAGDFGFTVAFRDDFEAGTLDRWSDVDGLVVEEGDARAGTAAARAASADGSRSYAALDFAAAATELYVQTAFRLDRQGDNPVSLLRLRTDANAQVVSLYVTSSGRLAVQVAGDTSVTGAAVVVPGRWHEVQVHVVVAGVGSRVEVWFDGQVVDRLQLTTDLGTTPVRTVQLGESAEGRTFDVRFDDVATDTAFIPSAFLILVGGPPAGASPGASPAASPGASPAASPAASPGATPSPPEGTPAPPTP